MTATEQSLLEALRELEQAAAARSLGSPAQARPPVLPILERIDRLAADLPSDAPADLRHYLQRKSYEKARLLLLDRGDENVPGRCGH